MRVLARVGIFERCAVEFLAKGRFDTLAGDDAEIRLLELRDPLASWPVYAINIGADMIWKSN